MSPTPALLEWVHRLQHSLYPHVFPISFGPKSHPEGLKINSATAFLLDLGARPFLVTAGHVTDEMTAAFRRDPNLRVVLGKHEVRWQPSDVFRVRSRSTDLATIPLNERLVSSLTADYRVVQPPVWPPPEFRTSDAVIFSGFPASWRIVESWDDVEFRAILSLALVRSFNLDEFLCHMDPAYLEERVEPTSIEDLPELVDLGGLSGAPAFLARNEPEVLVVIPQLCGIVKEGGVAETLGPGHRLVYFTRLDRLRQDGTA